MLTRALPLALALVAAPGLAAASLIGDTIDVIAGGDPNNGLLVVDDIANPEIVAGDGSMIGNELLFQGESIDFRATSIVLVLTEALSDTFSVSGIDAELTGVSLGQAPSMTDSITDVTFDANSFSVTLNLSAPPQGTPSFATILNLTFADPMDPVPLPAGIALLLTGVAGLALVRRRG